MWGGFVFHVALKNLLKKTIFRHREAGYTGRHYGDRDRHRKTK